MSAELTIVETASLAEHEAVIERGIKTFYEVGVALAEIRDQRLYRQDFGTFEEYCERRWNLSRPRAYQLIEAATVVSTFVDTALPPPSNESQARALARVPEEQRAEIWRETLERTDGKPTAAAIRESYAPPPAPPAPQPWAAVDDEEDEPLELPPALPDGPRHCKYCYGEHELEYGPDGSLIVCSHCGAGLAPMDRVFEAGGYDAFVEEINEQFVAYHNAVREFPELNHYEAQPRKAISLAENLRQFTDPELAMRRENLAKAIAADQRRSREVLPQPAGPDHSALADEVFLAVNAAAQVIARNGGTETVRAAVATATPLVLEAWRDQFNRMAEACSAMAAECTPKLRSIQ